MAGRKLSALSAHTIVTSCQSPPPPDKHRQHLLALPLALLPVPATSRPPCTAASRGLAVGRSSDEQVTQLARHQGWPDAACLHGDERTLASHAPACLGSRAVRAYRKGLQTLASVKQGSRESYRGWSTEKKVKGGQGQRLRMQGSGGRAHTCG
eukprot:765537-Hanusia_phi.AAC.3